MRGALREIDSNACGFPDPVAIPLRDRDLREAAPVSASGKPRPAWWLLYAILPLTAFAFGLADLVPAASGWRPVSELLATLAIFVGIGLWRRANRVALILATYGDGSDRAEDADLPDFPEAGQYQ